MEKVGVLITRLLEQHRNKSTIEQLRITTQLLLSELQREEEEQNFQSVASVFYPSTSQFSTNKGREELAVLPEHGQDSDTIVNEEEIRISTARPSYGFFDPMIEIPTLALKQQEVNETVGIQKESLNDKLKATSSHKEVSHKMADEPIKDLRKAIGINDQYLFINELFRGDQTMYERSIKTINGFNIYGEAEFWIKRELKLKLAWNENSGTAKLFDQLVRRRFA